MTNMFDLKDVLDYLDGTYDDINLLFKDIKGYTTNEMEKGLMKRLLRIKKNYLLGKQFQENQKKGKRKGKRYFYVSNIKEALKEGKTELVNSYLYWASMDVLLNKISRQTIWRLKKELRELGIPEKSLIQLSKYEKK